MATKDIKSKLRINGSQEKSELKLSNTTTSFTKRNDIIQAYQNNGKGGILFSAQKKPQYEKYDDLELYLKDGISTSNRKSEKEVTIKSPAINSFKKQTDIKVEHVTQDTGYDSPRNKKNNTNPSNNYKISTMKKRLYSREFSEKSAFNNKSNSVLGNFNEKYFINEEKETQRTQREAMGRINSVEMIVRDMEANRENLQNGINSSREKGHVNLKNKCLSFQVNSKIGGTDHKQAFNKMSKSYGRFFDKKHEQTKKGPDTLIDALPYKTKSQQYFPKNIFKQLSVKDFKRYDPECTYDRRTKVEFQRILSSRRNTNNISDNYQQKTQSRLTTQNGQMKTFKQNTQSLTNFVELDTVDSHNTNHQENNKLASCLSPLNFRNKGYNSKDGFFFKKDKIEEDNTMLKRDDTYTKILEKYKRCNTEVSSKFDPKKDICFTEEERNGNIKTKLGNPTTWAEKNKMYENNLLPYSGVIIENIKLDKAMQKIAMPDTPFAYKNNQDEIDRIKNEKHKLFQKNTEKKKLPIKNNKTEPNDIGHQGMDPNFISSPSSLLKTTPVGQLRRGYTAQSPHYSEHGFFEGELKSAFITSALFYAKHPNATQKLLKESPFFINKDVDTPKVLTPNQQSPTKLNSPKGLSQFSKNPTKNTTQGNTGSHLNSEERQVTQLSTGQSFFRQLFAEMNLTAKNKHESKESETSKVQSFAQGIVQMIAHASPEYYKRIKPITSKSVVVMRNEIKLEELNPLKEIKQIEKVNVDKHIEDKKAFQDEKKKETDTRKQQTELNKKRIQLDKKTRMIPFEERKDFLPQYGDKAKQFSTYVVNHLDYKDRSQPAKFLQTKDVQISKSGGEFNPLVYQYIFYTNDSFVKSN